MWKFAGALFTCIRTYNRPPKHIITMTLSLSDFRLRSAGGLRETSRFNGDYHAICRFHCHAHSTVKSYNQNSVIIIITNSAYSRQRLCWSSGPQNELHPPEQGGCCTLLVSDTAVVVDHVIHRLIAGVRLQEFDVSVVTAASRWPSSCYICYIWSYGLDAVLQRALEHFTKKSLPIRKLVSVASVQCKCHY